MAKILSHRQPSTSISAETANPSFTKSQPPAQLFDLRPKTALQRQTQHGINNSPRVTQAATLQRVLGGSTRMGQPSSVIQRHVLAIEGYAGAPLDTNEVGMTAIKAYVDQLLIAKNSLGMAAVTNQIRINDPAKSEEIATYRETKLLQLMTPLTQADDATRLSAALGTPIGQGGAHTIPQSIHRFWSGGPLTDSAMATLLESATKTAATPWTHTLWYSSGFEAGIRKPAPSFWKYKGEEREAYNRDQAKIAQRDRQRRQLRDARYRIRAIEELVSTGTASSGVTADELRTASGMAADSVKSGEEWDDLKYFSDIARLMYLHAEGGHHMDVDIGLGRMNMGQQYAHNDPLGEVPLMGTLARDMTEAGRGPDVVPRLLTTTTYQSNPYSGGVIPETYTAEVTALATRASGGAAMFNAMIASRARTGNLQAAINGIMVSMRRPDRSMASGMSVTRELLAGAISSPGHEARLDAAFHQSVPPYLLRLEHITEESDR